MSEVEPSRVYRHIKTNGLYVARLVAVNPNTAESQVIYTRMKEEDLFFCRPIEEFMAKFEATCFCM